ncbi:MAG TPA: DUF1844 domain-containing protein [Candidatus Binataceae bacterium]|nr:DUF1844 domain-containing protein [Candidatus Binataceae bacterium]
MAPEDEGSKGYKIQDRRRFSAEGELKPEFSGADAPAAATPDAPAAAKPETPSRPRGPAQPQAEEASQPQQAAAARGYAAARSAADPEGHPAQAGAETGEISFGAFLMSLSTEALVHLGEMADPSSGQEQRDLAMAQQLIDILGMLRDKTRGNLEHDEQALLDAILFDLRMKYVEIARRNG